MQLVKSITLKKIKTLRCFFLTFLVSFSAAFTPAFSQDNSPYSRYGIGDLVPSTHINTRGMAGISAGYIDALSINFNNPASYSAFEAWMESKKKKLASGRAILDIGINIDSRTLRETNPARKFTAGNLLFSYVQVGVPLKRSWGLSFGLRPVSRISYKIFRGERLKDPITGQPIDSATTRFEGDGGSYLASAGTGFTVFRKEKFSKIDKKKSIGEESLNIGFNAGYLFGKINNSSRREFRNDTVQYFSANYETITTYGNINFSAGLQYRLPLGEGNKLFSAGIYGSWGQQLNASQDRIRETFVYDATLGDLRLDSVQDIRDVKGKIVMPASITAGFILQKFPVVTVNKKEGGWLLGLDVMYQTWDNYRFYGQKDSVRNKLEVRIGGQVSPVPRESYFSRVAYRAGFILGPDYLSVQGKLPQYGITMGLGLPVGNYNRLSPYQRTEINLAFEFIKRGNNDNLLKENLFRISAGFSLSDIWFQKRKYD
ncbi:MAG: hypothetical protein ACT4OJ_07660 [Bacteroidota bacterium]